MAWKITFAYEDGSITVVSNKHKELPLDLAVKYRNRYASQNNDGGIVQISPYKHNDPMPLNKYIAELEGAE